MAELARGLAESLAGRDEVTVFTLAAHRGSPLVSPIALRGRPEEDAARLHPLEQEFDAFLLMNAGLTPLLERLRNPASATGTATISWSPGWPAAHAGSSG